MKTDDADADRADRFGARAGPTISVSTIPIVIQPSSARTTGTREAEHRAEFVAEIARDVEACRMYRPAGVAPCWLLEC